MTEMQQLKQPLRAFYRNESTEVLCQVLAMAQDGKIRYNGCCCYIGATTSNLAKGNCNFLMANGRNHYQVAAEKPFAREAETAIRIIGEFLHRFPWNPLDKDVARRKIVIAIIKGILRLRERDSRHPRQNGAEVVRVSPTQKILQEVQHR